MRKHIKDDTRLAEVKRGKLMQWDTGVLGRIHESTIYLPVRHDKIAKAAALCGVTSIAALARLCNVPVDTCTRWIGRHDSFRKAFEEGINYRSLEVEAALAKRAIGYNTVEKMVRKIKDSTGIRKTIEKRTVHVPGDVGAQKFYLENRKTKRWTKSKNVVSKSMNLNMSIDATDAEI